MSKYPIHKRYFNGGMNADSGFELVEPNQWVNACNIRTFSTDTGATNLVENTYGTRLLFNNLPAGQNFCIGGCEDDANKRLFWLNWNSNGDHGIYVFDKRNAIGYTVLQNNDVTGGLGFSKDNYIHSCFFVNGAIYWVNGQNSQPRRINADRGIKAYQPGYGTALVPYSFPIAQSVISWIRKPGGIPPTLTKVAQTIPVIDYNYIKYGAFQFCYRYCYRDSELSTLSALSPLANYNSEGDLFNRIDVEIPSTEFIEQDVLSIDLVVRYVEDNNYFIIKSWSKDVPAEATEIANHIAGTTPLNYQFYNDTVGIVLDDAYKVKEFDSFPINVETIEIAKGRAFLGNYTEGYNTPSETSLAVSFATSHIGTTSLSTITGDWYNIHFKITAGFSVTNYDYKIIRTNYVEGPISPAPVYYFKIATAVPPYPSTLLYADLTFIGSTPQSVADHFRVNVIHSAFPATNITLTSQAADSVITFPGTVSSSFLSKAFKSGCPYQIGITFYDEYQRKCGIKTNRQLLVNIPDAILTNDYVTLVDWVLSNTNALTEIPDWAFYYSINITRSLSTRFFLQGAGLAIYAAKDAAGLYTYTTNNYNNSLAGIAIDLTCLDKYHMGYSFTEGDIARIRIGTTEHTLAVTGTDGIYVILELKDVGTLAPTNSIFELLTPFKRALNEPFFEVGKMYKVLNPTTTSRQYNVLNGTIGGDIYLILKTFSSASFVAECMSINDKFWRRWNTDAGRPNQIDTIGQKKKQDSICFSDVFIPGTLTNGLSSFSALNTETLDTENGAIRRLILASKVQTDGSVMLAICENESVSIYLGEQEIFDTQGSAYITRASGVIGSFKALRGSYGTFNPESAVENNGLIFWWDTKNGCAVQYSANGLFPISKNNFMRAANLFSSDFNALTAAQITTLGSRPFIIGGYDSHHKEVLFTIPTTRAVAPKGNLIDYSSRVYPYDIYDAQGKTLIYKNEKDMWLGSMSFQAEKFLRLDNDLYSFKNGALSIHNQPGVFSFYNVPFKSTFAYSNNPKGINTFLGIGLEVTKAPKFVHLASENPYVQSSDLIDTDFRNYEGVKYSGLFRDRLSPNVPGNYELRQTKGDRLFGKYLLTMLEFDFTDGIPMQLTFSNIEHILNEGHII